MNESHGVRDNGVQATRQPHATAGRIKGGEETILSEHGVASHKAIEQG